MQDNASKLQGNNERLTLNVDTINDNPGEFWAHSDQLIETAHTMEKKMFFVSFQMR